MNFNFKKTTDDALEIGEIAAGMIGSKKFLDFGKFFPAAPADSAMIKYQGGIRLIGGLMLRENFAKKSRLVKNLFTGIAIEGAITQIGELTTKDDKRFFEPIGNNREETAQNSETLRKLDEMLRNAKMNGAPDVTQQYGSGVNGPTPTQQYGSGVNGPDLYASNPSASGVNGY